MSVVAVLCLVLAVLSHVVVTLVDYYLNLPPPSLKQATTDLAIANKELCGVRSIQAQFVKHSKLSRQKLKLEKKIEEIKAAQVPKIAGVKKILSYVKVGSLTALCWAVPTTRQSLLTFTLFINLGCMLLCRGGTDGSAPDAGNLRPFLYDMAPQQHPLPWTRLQHPPCLPALRGRDGMAIRICRTG